MIAGRILMSLALGLVVSGGAMVKAQTGTDAFASRPLLMLSGGAVTASANNTAASAENLEPAHLGDPAARSVWWRWTPQSTGVAQVDTVGTTINTRLVVYTGNVLAALAPVASNLGSSEAPEYESLVRFQALAGTTYSICVDGHTDAASGVTETGPITLNIRHPGPGAPPGNDLFGEAAVLPPMQSVTITGTTADASVESGEPGAEPAYESLGPARTVWFAWTAPVGGFFTLRIEADAILSWEPVAAVYTGSSLGSLTALDQAETVAFSPGEFDRQWVSATFRATAGQAYRIQVGARAFLTTSGPFDLVLAPAVRPVGDDFAVPADAGNAFTYAGEGSLLEATREAAEPNHFAPIGGSTSISSASIWWKWTAPVSGPVTIDTRGSDGDTVMTIYRAGAGAASLENLVVVAGNDDINFNWDSVASAVSFSANAGQTYYIAITGYSQSSRVLFHLATGERRAPYEAWLLGYPTMTGAAAARTADPDGDGLTNLQELLHGTHPLLPSYFSEEERLLLPTLFIEGGHLVLQCGHANDNIVGLSDGFGAGGLPLVVAAWQSADLVSWVGLPAADVSLGRRFAFAAVPLTTGSSRWLRVSITDPNR